MKKALIIESKSSAYPKNIQLIEEVAFALFDLICIIGRDCVLWEDIVDETLIGANGDHGESLPITTSHPNESMTEVEEFARTFFKSEKVELAYIKI
jgi:hypothetical protein